MMKRDYLSVNQAASELGISRAAVYSAIREGRLESEVVLGKIAVTRKSLARYKPNQDRIRAGKIRLAQNPSVVIEIPKTSQRAAGEELLDLEELSYGYYTLTGSHSIHLEFTDRSSDTYTGQACDAIFRDLTERPNIIEISRESGIELINVLKIYKVVFSIKTPQQEAVIKIQPVASKPGKVTASGAEAEAVWEELRRIRKPTVLTTLPSKSVARTGTED